MQGRGLRERSVEDDRTLLGERVKAARVRQGVSQRQLAAALGVSPATMSAVENGRIETPAPRLARIAEVLGVPVSGLSAGDARGEEAAASGRGSGLGGAAAGERPADWRVFPPLEMSVTLAAGLAAFLEFGYHGATMRDIAQRAGLSVPGVYHYYPTKQDILVDVLALTMEDLAWRTAAARAEGETAVERFALLVECLALYHTHRRELGFVGASEMRSLVPFQRRRIADQRRAQQGQVDEEVEAACRQGWFSVLRPREASRAVVTMCTALPQWFDGEGPLGADQVAAHYVEFALDLMRCVPEARPARWRAISAATEGD